MTTSPIPFYYDWTFWSAIIAFIAIILSQLPPIHLLIKPKRIDVEVNSRIQITHKVGNPNVGLHVGITNRGGRDIRIRGLKIVIRRDNKELISMPAQSFFEKSTDPAVLFVPFLIRPNEYWSHGVNFLNFFDRSTEKTYRASEFALKSDIEKKIASRDANDKNPVKAESNLVEPFLNLFKKFFLWEPGEYIIELLVDTEPASATYSKKYRFTLYESDTLELKKHTDDYIMGGGIYFNIDSHAGVFVALSEHIG